MDYYKEQLKKFVAKMEEVTGNKIDEDEVRKNFAKTNAINERLRKISELRKKNNPPIGFSEFIKLNHYSFAVDNDVMIGKLDELYDELKDAPGKFTEDLSLIHI